MVLLTYKPESHPTWVRGLKHISGRSINSNVRVAPYVGAWIETYVGQSGGSVSPVAPYVGAWIETRCPAPARHPALSHPTWVRGLKLKELELYKINEVSHPTWVRGLKLAGVAVDAVAPVVAPYVGAWIETCQRRLPVLL